MTVKLLNGERVYNDWYNFAATKYQGVSAGCAVTEKAGTPDMSVDVASGTAIVAGLEVTVTGANVAIGPSDPTNDRFDLVVVDGSGTLSIIAGTPATDPKPDDSYDPTLYAILARVRVQDTVTQILDADIKDMRFVPGGGGGGSPIIVGAPQSGCSDGDVVRFNGTNYVPAQADTVDNSKAVGLISDISGGTGNIYLFGEADFLTGLTAGSTYYLSAGTAGALTDERPALGVKIGEATSATTLIIDIDRFYAAVGGSYVDAFTSQTSVVVNHNLNDSDVLVQVYDNLGEQITPDTIDITDADNVTVTFSSSTTGKVVVYSMTGFTTETGVTSYYSMGFTGTNIVVNHNLNQQYVNVQCYNGSDELIEPDTVTLDNANQLTVTFGVSTTGRVVVVGGAFFTSVGGSGDIIPDTDDAYDLGSNSNRWKDGYFAGKLTVVGGVDPAYIQLTPQATSTGVLDNSLFVDDTDKKLKFKDNTGAIVGFADDALTQEVIEHEIEIIELQANAAIGPYDHDTLLSETYSDSNGYNNYVDLGLEFTNNQYYFKMENNQDDDGTIGGLTGTLQGSAAYDASVFKVGSYSLDMPGTSDGDLITSFPTAWTKFTSLGWWYVDTLPGSNAYLLQQQESASWGHVEMAVTAAGKIAITVYDGVSSASSALFTAVDVVPGTWHHICFHIEVGKPITLWFDNNKYTGTAVSSLGPRSGNLYIGRGFAGTGADCHVDNLRLNTDATLTDSQVDADYNGGAGYDGNPPIIPNPTTASFNGQSIGYRTVPALTDVFIDTFTGTGAWNDHSADTNPGGDSTWTASGGSGNPQTIETTFGRLHTQSGGGASPGAEIESGVALTSNGDTAVAIMKNSSASNACQFYLKDIRSGGLEVARVGMDVSGNFFTRDGDGSGGSSDVTLVSFTPGLFQTVQIVMNFTSQRYNVIIDGTTYNNGGVGFGFVNGTSSVAAIGFGNTFSSFGDFDVDDVRLQQTTGSSTQKVVEHELPAISGTVTDVQLVVHRVLEDSGDSVTFDITDGVGTDADIPLNTKFSLVNVTGTPTKMTLNLNPLATEVYGTSVKTWALKLWKS